MVLLFWIGFIEKNVIGKIMSDHIVIVG
jgi:hypothetical protein